MIPISEAVFDKLTLIPRPDGQEGEWRRLLGQDEGGSSFAVPDDPQLVAVADDINDAHYLVMRHPWTQCPNCENKWCEFHDQHAHECPCPAVG